MPSEESTLSSPVLRRFVGRSPAFQEALALIRRFARSRAPVLIHGETGTGKELAAHAIHYASKRADAPFVPVNCGSLPDALIESELFGHAKGAFTDAGRSRAGLVRAAEGGTLFLDEVEALSRRGQVVLLRFLQDASFRAVGEETRRQADVRIVTASNVPLRTLAERGEFRHDLLFRLDVLSVELPPLRERRADIGLLAAHLLEKAARDEGGAVKVLTGAALESLQRHDWPGNVRELEHVLLRAHLLCGDDAIDATDLRHTSRGLAGADVVPEVEGHTIREAKQRALHDVECRFVERALARSAGNISQAARICQMERAAFSRMAKRCREGRSPVAMQAGGLGCVS